MRDRTGVVVGKVLAVVMVVYAGVVQLMKKCGAVVPGHTFFTGIDDVETSSVVLGPIASLL